MPTLPATYWFTPAETTEAEIAERCQRSLRVRKEIALRKENEKLERDFQRLAAKGKLIEIV